LVWEPQATRGSRPGPGARLETPIFGFEEPRLRPGLGTSSCNRGSGLQTLNLGFEEEEEIFSISLIYISSNVRPRLVTRLLSDSDNKWQINNISMKDGIMLHTHIYIAFQTPM
jgi:hypothetical protein